MPQGNVLSEGLQPLSESSPGTFVHCTPRPPRLPEGIHHPFCPRTYIIFTAISVCATPRMAAILPAPTCIKVHGRHNLAAALPTRAASAVGPYAAIPGYPLTPKTLFLVQLRPHQLFHIYGHVLSVAVYLSDVTFDCYPV